MLDVERRKEILSELLAVSDGTRADDYATLQVEFDDLQTELDRLTTANAKLTDANTVLKRENFKLFERVGASSIEEVETQEEELMEPETRNYLEDVVDKNGFFM